MENYKSTNNAAVLEQVEQMLWEAAEWKTLHPYWRKQWKIREVCERLSIFDWWNEDLSVSQLQQMRSFLKTAAKLGYNGYVCFKVGAAGCANGMWAHKEETTTGYSPDGECLYHSFVSGENYYDVQLADGLWAHEINNGKFRYTLAEIKQMLEQRRV